MHGSGRKCPVCREDLSALARTLSTALRRPEDDTTEQDPAGEDNSDADNVADGTRECAVEPGPLLAVNSRVPSDDEQSTVL